MIPKYFFLVLLVAEVSFAQQKDVLGQVFEERTNLPITNATVSIESSFLETQSDKNGRFGINNTPDGSHVLIISKGGYLTKKLPYSKKSGESINFKKIYLTLDVQTLQHENTVTLTESSFEDDVDANIPSGMLQSTRDVFLTRVAFDFSQSFFKVKGYDAKYGEIYINGIKMNELYNGKPQWSTWGGLNDVTRNQEHFHGLKANPYAFGGISGATFITTNPAEMRKGSRISASASNRTYTGRLMTTYNSGLTNSGFSYSVSASRRWANKGYVDGTLYDAYSLFTSVGYQIKERNNFYITGFFTPSTRGKSAPITQEVFELGGRTYNPYWGKQNQKVRNSRIRKMAFPMLMFNYDYSGEKFNLKFGAAYRLGNYGSSRLGYYGAPNPNPDYYKYLPSYYINNTFGANFENSNLARDAFKNDPQIQWSTLYLVNQSPDEKEKSAYVLHYDQTDSRQLSFNLNANYTINPLFKIDAGASYLKSTSENYALITDLLGAKHHEDVDPFSNTKNDVHGNLQKKEGDRIGYNYIMNASSYEGFIQASFNFKALNCFASTKVSKTAYQRNGLFLNERFIENSEGKSNPLSFLNYGVKGGLTYKINNRHIFNAHGGLLTKAPTLQNAFINARENNKTVKGLLSETIYTGSLTYYLKLPKITARVTGYYTRFKELTNINYFYINTGVGSDFVQEVVTGIHTQHYGGELGVAYRATSEIKLTAVAAYGDFSYASDANTEINFDTVGAENKLINTQGYADLGTASIKNYKEAVGPQKAYSIGIEYRSPKYWWIGLTGNYLDDNYVGISTIKRTQNFLQNPDDGTFSNATEKTIARLLKQEKLLPVYLLNLTGGKSWLVKEKYIGLFVSINNLFDATYQTGGYEQSRNANFKQAYQDEKRGAPSFENKYWYGYGRTFFVNLSLNF